MTVVIARSDGSLSPPAPVTQYRRLNAADTDAVLAMLLRCSRDTLYRRFHGVTDGTAYARQLLRAPSGHDTLGAWCETRCVAIATLADGSDGCSDVGVLVEDAWQRRGLGTALLAQLVGIARRRGIGVLTADVLADSVHVLRWFGRVGTVEARLSWGVYHARVTLAESRGAATG